MFYFVGERGDCITDEIGKRNGDYWHGGVVLSGMWYACAFEPFALSQFTLLDWLYCAVLCCIVLCCVVLCYAMLCCIMFRDSQPLWPVK